VCHLGALYYLNGLAFDFGSVWHEKMKTLAKGSLNFFVAIIRKVFRGSAPSASLRMTMFSIGEQ
jgi:hypothetical protein